MSAAEERSVLDGSTDGPVSGSGAGSGGGDRRAADPPGLEEHPELIVGAAFLGGIVAAWMLRRLRR